MAKETSRFFNIRRIRGDFRMFLRGKQVATIFSDKDTGTFWVVCANNTKCAYDLKSFKEADDWVWGNYA